MLLPNVLNCYSLQHGEEILLDVTIYDIRIMNECKMKFQDAFQTDSLLCAYVGIVISDLSESVDAVPHSFCPYWSLRDFLTIENESHIGSIT